MICILPKDIQRWYFPVDHGMFFSHGSNFSESKISRESMLRHWAPVDEVLKEIFPAAIVSRRQGWMIFVGSEVATGIFPINVLIGRNLHHIGIFHFKCCISPYKCTNQNELQQKKQENIGLRRSFETFLGL